MPEQNEWVVAFAGSGDTTLENATALLNNWITDDTGIKDFYVPAKINKRSEKGLANVVSYLTETWEEFQTAPVGEFIDILVSNLANGLDAYLVVIIGDGPPDDITADLVEAALEAGIPVKDLAAGLDDITETGEDTTETVAPEPQEPAPATTRRRRTGSTPEASKPAEAVSEPSVDGNGPRPKRRGQPRSDPAYDKQTDGNLRDITGSPVPDDPWKEDLPGGVPTRTTASGGPGEAVTRATTAGVEAAAATLMPGPDISAEVRAALAEAFFAAAQALSGQAVTGAPAGPTTAYIKSEDGSLRKRGRGKPKTGEEVVFLTDKEVTAAVEKGLLDQ
jgi:hypothetical protein